jgi:N-acetylglutamate synthase-like GNAT family acetyltransferase
MNVRPAIQSDWPAIEALLAGSALPLEGAREHLGDFLVAWEDGALAATGGVEWYEGCGLLRSVAVAESHRGCALAATIVLRLIAEARVREARSLHLLTTTAADYFARHGFVVSSKEGAPAVLGASAQFSGACPASATFMTLAIQSTP